MQVCDQAIVCFFIQASGALLRQMRLVRSVLAPMMCLQAFLTCWAQKELCLFRCSTLIFAMEFLLIISRPRLEWANSLSVSAGMMEQYEQVTPSIHLLRWDAKLMNLQTLTIEVAMEAILHLRN